MSERLEAARRAGYELGLARPLTSQQKDVIRSVVRLHLTDKRAA